jgi:acyl-coenzyme A synthetase/AMP-(fatty) acid ligase
VNVATDLERLASRSGWDSRPAFLVADTVWTHGQVHDIAARASTVLHDRGLRPGMRVLVALPDGIALVATFLAAARLGALAVLVNPALPVRDHQHLAADCDAALVVGHDELAERFDGVRWLAAAELLAAAANAQPAAALDVDPSTTLYVQYTSGTTGQPKGAVHRHGDLEVYDRNARQLALRMGADDVGLSVSRLHFAYGFGNSLVYPLYSGSAAVLTARRPAPDDVRELAQRHQVTVLYAVPSAFANLIAADGTGLRSPLRACVSAGEALVPVLAQRLTESLRAPVLDGLGSTELGGFCCMNDVERQVPGTIGLPLPDYQLQVRDEAGAPVEPGAAGRLWVRGPTVMSGYLGKPEQTARAVVQGWLLTGDRAIRNSDGTYTLLGRNDDMEMVGGITVSPLEVERVLAEHPGVRDVAVAAVADERGASKLRAFVVPAAREPDPDRLEADLIGLARARLAAFKVPRSVSLVDTLPRTATGKLRRFIVRRGCW